MILRAKHKRMLLDLIAVYLPTDVQVIAYGSRVDGTAHEGSDLDLSLKSKGQQPIDSEVLYTFVKAVQHSNIPFLVQILDWSRLPKSFHAQIEQNGVVLNEASVSGIE